MPSEHSAADASREAAEPLPPSTPPPGRSLRAGCFAALLLPPALACGGLVFLSLVGPFAMGHTLHGVAQGIGLSVVAAVAGPLFIILTRAIMRLVDRGRGRPPIRLLDWRGLLGLTWVYGVAAGLLVGWWLLSVLAVAEPPPTAATVGLVLDTGLLYGIARVARTRATSR